MRWIVVILLILTITNKYAIAAKKSSHSKRTQQNQHADISKLLDKLLENYDNSLRPNFGNKPIVVEIDLMVRSMGPVSEIEMTYSMDCYFRQSWVDRRLAFDDATANVTTLALSISMLKKIWKPDTFIFNGKQSYLHTITTPNKFVRLYNDGRVLYSSRLTIKAACPMSLEDFPMDIQHCPLKLGSFGYTTKDVLYRWNSRAVAISDDLRMSQFDLIDVPSSNESLRLGDERHGKQTSEGGAQDEYSVLLVSFHLQRHMGNFVIQVYGPCILLVILSWVSFWLNREATADRISLGITTVLTMTFLGLESRTDLPKVTYPTALDFFVFISFAFIFATILQFAVVHYFTKYGSGECYYDFYESSDESGDEEDANEDTAMSSTSHLSSLSQLDAGDIYGVIPLSRFEIDSERRESRVVVRALKRCKKFTVNYFFCQKLFSKRNVDDGTESISESEQQQQQHHATLSTENTAPNSPHVQQLQENIDRKDFRKNNNMQRGRRTFNSVSKIDEVSRVVFPLCFFVINLIYWTFYLYRSQRK